MKAPIPYQMRIRGASPKREQNKTCQEESPSKDRRDKYQNHGGTHWATKIQTGLSSSTIVERGRQRQDLKIISLKNKKKQDKRNKGIGK